MKLLLTALVAVLTSSLCETTLARSADPPPSDLVLHKSGLVVSQAASSATPDAGPTKTVVLRRSGIVVPGSSKIEYRRALAATSDSSGVTSSPASSNGDLSAFELVLICLGGVLSLCGATYLGTRLVRRHRFASTRIA
jgi:hypothetical protein